MSVYPNKFSSVCSGCSKQVQIGEGYVQKVDMKFVPWCKSCVPVRLNLHGNINENYEIFIPYDPTAVSLVKSLPKAKWNPQSKCWSVSKDPKDRARVLEVCSLLSIEIHESIKQEPVELLLDADVLNTIKSSSMYDFQKEGSIFCATKDRCLLGDEMGLGKSVQALMSIPKNSPVMIICRAGIKFNWLNEVSKWRPDLKAVVLSGRDSFYWPEKNEVVIINHDILPKLFSTPPKIKGEGNRYADRLATFRKELSSMNQQASSTFLIVDEAHDFKNYSSQRSKKLKEICRMVKKVIGLTGSPLSNRPPELYGVFNVLGISDETFGSYENFKKLFNAREQVVNRLGQLKTVWGSPKPIVPELLKRKMIRRLRQNVLPDLPQKTYTTVFVDLFDKSLKEKMDGLLEDWKGVIGLGELPPFTSFSEARKSLAKDRIPQMLELVEDAEDQEVPLVVFSSHLSPLDALLTRPGWAVISGDTKPELRQKIVDAFQRNELKGVGVSIKAGGVGITLTNAWKALFVDLDWSPASNWQAEDRIARIGQKSKKVEIVRMVSNHPLDIHVNKLLVQKIDVIQKSIDGHIKVSNNKPPQETESEFEMRMSSLAFQKEAESLKRIKSRVSLIHQKELINSHRNELDLSICRNHPDEVVKAFKHMVSVCDGALQKDAQGFNKPDSLIAHWVLSSGLSEPNEIETAFLILSRYKRQLAKIFPCLFEKIKTAI